MEWPHKQTACGALGHGHGAPVLNEKQLTASIKQTNTCERLLQLFTLHKGRINSIHVAAILTKLANITKVQPHQAQEQGQSAPMQTLSSAEAREALVLQLQDLLKSQRCGGHCPRGLANIIWALGKIQTPPDAELVNMLLRQFFKQLSAAIPQDIANVLWGVAQITRDHGLICPPGCKESVAAADTYEPFSSANSSSLLDPFGTALPQAAAAAAGAEVCGEACGSSVSAASRAVAASAAMHAQQSNSTATAGDGPMEPLLTIEQVQQLLHRLCQMLAQAAPQTISNITCAICVLQHCHRWCMCSCLEQVRQLVAAFVANINESLPSHIYKVVKCLTQLSLACAGHAREQWISWQPPVLQAMLSHMIVQRRTLKQFHIMSVLRDVTQTSCLFLPLEVTTELAPASVAAAAKAAAAAAAAEPVAAQQQQAAVGARAAYEADTGVLLALATAAAAVDEILDTGVFSETDDDSGLPLSGLHMAAAAATAAAAAAAAAAAQGQTPGACHSETCAGDEDASPRTPPLLDSADQPGRLRGSSAGNSRSGAASDHGSPVSPGTAVVRSIVLDMFQRLAVTDAGTGSVAAPQAGSADPAAVAAPATALHGAGTVGGRGPCISNQKDAPAARNSSTRASVLEKLLQQLESLGLLQQYNVLRSYSRSQSMVTSGVTGGTPTLGTTTVHRGYASGRTGQLRGSGYMGSGGMPDHPPHTRQQLSWPQHQLHTQPPRQPPQQSWDPSMQQQPRQIGIVYRSDTYSSSRWPVMGAGAVEGGVSGGVTSQQQRMGPTRAQVLMPGRQGQQQQQHGASGSHPAPPPPQFQHHQVTVLPDTGLGGYLDSGNMRLNGQDPMVSPFQFQVPAGAAAMSAADMCGMTSDMSSPHDSSASGSFATLYGMTATSSKTNTSMTSGSQQLVGSSSMTSVPSTQAGLVGGFGSGPLGAGSGNRIRNRLPAQMSSPPGVQGAAISASPGRPGHANVPQVPSFSSSNTPSLAVHHFSAPVGSMGVAGMVDTAGMVADYRQQQQQQQLYMGLGGGSSGPAGHGVFAETVSALSPEHSTHSMHSVGGCGMQRMRSIDEPPGLMSAGTAQQHQQLVQRAVAQNANAGMVMITQDGQQMPYQRMPDGTLVPVRQQQMQQNACVSTMSLPGQQQEQQSQQAQEQLQLLVERNVQGTRFNMAGGNVAAVMAAVQQQQQQANQQQAMLFQLQPMQQLLPPQGQMLYGLSGGGTMSDGTSYAGGEMTFVGRSVAETEAAAAAGYMAASAANGAGSQLQLYVDSGSGATVAAVSQGTVTYTLLNQGQLATPEQQQQLMYQQQLMQQQQEVMGGMVGVATSTV